jgi:O-antigen ligase
MSTDAARVASPYVRAALFVFGAALPYHGVVAIEGLPAVGAGDLLFFVPLLLALRETATLRRDRALLAPLGIVVVGFAAATLLAGAGARSFAQIAVFAYTALLFFVGARLARAGLAAHVRDGLVAGVALNVTFGLLGAASIKLGGPAMFIDDTWWSAPGAGPVRITGLTESPNMLAAEATVALALLLAAKELAPRARVLVGVLAFGLVLTLGHVTLAGACGLSVYLASRSASAPWKRRAFAGVAAGSFAAMVGLIFWRGLPLTSELPFVDTGLAAYAVCDRTALAMFRAHPLAGVGLERFIDAWPAYVDRAFEARAYPAYAEGPHAALDPHSTYLGFAAEAGVFGVAVVAALIALGLRARRAAEPAFLALLAYALVAGLVMDVLTNRELFLGLGLLACAPLISAKAAGGSRSAR